MSAHTVVIVNPASGAGRGGVRVAELEELVREQLAGARIEHTRGPGHAGQLAREAALQGARRIVVAGGDGTVSEALSGLLPLALADPPALGLLPLGTGRDYARALGLGDDLAEIVRRLASDRVRRVDAGQVVCRGAEGGERVHYFLNIASCGVSGAATVWVQERGRLGRRGRATYALSGLLGLWRYRSPRVAIRVDGVLVHDGRLTLAAIANGRYFGGGMLVAPQAVIDDGLFDVVIMDGMSRLRALACFPLLIGGRHLRRSEVRVLRGRHVDLEADGEVWLEADGEPLGTLPARVSLLPAAVALCGL